ncbi:MAG: DUF924 family protein [Pseudomonadota bacterium]
MTAGRPDPHALLDFWFEEAGPKRWYATDPAFDAKIRRLYGPLAHRLDAEPLDPNDAWLDTPETGLALAIALDQFPRNIWRGSGKAFALDEKARAASRQLIDKGFDLAIDPSRRDFLYMPFMHSEALDDQQLCIALVEERIGADSGTARHARLHRDVIATFGRFPYRNDALGRETTPDEAAYLERGGYAPGAKRPAKSSKP